MEKDRIEKINFYINLIIRITLVIAIPIAIWEQNWLFVFLSVLTLVLTFLPSFFERKYKIIIPSEIKIIILLFIYAGIFLGGVKYFYYRFLWFDDLLHFIAGIGIGFAGFLILYVLNKKGKFSASPMMIALLVFCFAVAIGALWEIFEFLMDYFLGYNMQKARNLELIYGYCDTYFGVIDTMVDMILNAIGALIASVAGYFYMKNGKFFLFDKLIIKFEKQNKKLLKK